jgi:hypothetical protein
VSSKLPKILIFIHFHYQLAACFITCYDEWIINQLQNSPVIGRSSKCMDFPVFDISDCYIDIVQTKMKASDLMQWLYAVNISLSLLLAWLVDI